MLLDACVNDFKEPVDRGEVKLLRTVWRYAGSFVACELGMAFGEQAHQPFDGPLVSAQSARSWIGFGVNVSSSRGLPWMLRKITQSTTFPSWAGVGF